MQVLYGRGTASKEVPPGQAVFSFVKVASGFQLGDPSLQGAKRGDQDGDINNWFSFQIRDCRASDMFNSIAARCQFQGEPLLLRIKLAHPCFGVGSKFDYSILEPHI